MLTRNLQWISLNIENPDWENENAIAQKWFADGTFHDNNEANPRTITHDMKFNSEQLSAIMDAIRQQVSIIVGPPGTGKSTIIEALIEYAELRENPFWLAAPSNKAVDANLEKLVARKMKQGCLDDIDLLDKVKKNYINVGCGVFSTISAASNAALKTFQPHTLIIDETSQTIEAEVLFLIF